MPDDNHSLPAPAAREGARVTADLLRRSFAAKVVELDRLRGDLARRDAQVELLRTFVLRRRQRVERDLAASADRVEEVSRLLRARSAQADRDRAEIAASRSTLAPAAARLRELEGSLVVRAIAKLRRAIRRTPAIEAHPPRDDERRAEAVRETGLFDEAFYRAQNPDLAASGIDLASHFAETGWWEGRRPNPRFDPAFYLASNPDVAASGQNPLVHYARGGLAEGRQALPAPKAARWLRPLDRPLSAEEVEAVEAVFDTGLFDEAFYRRANLDVVHLGLEPIVHYALDGWREGRWPNPEFDPAFYAARYADVAQAGTNPLVHFAEVGIAEGRVASDAAEAAPSSDDERTAAEIRATGLFDERYYLASNPDIAATGLDPALHFARVGWREGRKPRADFDPRFYLDRNPDIAGLDVNPLVHFAEHGLLEGRAFSPDVAAAEPFAPRPTSAYGRWAEAHDTLSDVDRRAIRARLLRLRRRPLISVVMPVYNPRVAFLREAVASVQAQLYPDWELCIADDASPDPAVRDALREMAEADPRIRLVLRPENGHISAASNSALALAAGEFVALMDHDDILPEHALFEVAAALDERPDLDILYSDEDHIDGSGRRNTPYFKSDFNLDLLRGHNLISHLGVYRRALLERIGGFRLGFEGSQDYDLALRAVDASSPARIHHIPAVLYHWRSDTGANTFSEAFMQRCIASARQAIADHLERRGERGAVVAHPTLPNWQRVQRPRLDPAPLVSVIVPTKDKADLVRACAEGILHRTDYPAIELLIVDHQSTEAEALALFDDLKRDPRVRVLPFAGPFNYAAINNAAVAAARGTVLALLNNDIDVIAPDWLDEMVALATLPDVGAVGAKLLYPDDRVQHAGVVIGIGGVANHFHHRLGRDDPGYFGRAAMTATVAAVTAACLVVRRDVFEAVGGFDAENLPVAFNDVDLCLKIRAAGYRNVWTPHALLYHHESVSRGSDLEGERRARFVREVEFMQDKWGEVLVEDPFYNPNLDTKAADFSLSSAPRRRKPWRG